MDASSCYICYSNSLQKRNILNRLKKKLAALNNDYLPDFKEENQTQLTNDCGFNRLLDIIFNDAGTLRTLHLTPKCSHDRLSKYLRRKLKCNSRTFNDLCNQLLQKIAERNYHLEVLSLQIKSLSSSCPLMALDHKNTQLMELISRNEAKSECQLVTASQLIIKQNKQISIIQQSIITNNYEVGFSPYVSPFVALSQNCKNN